MTKYTTRHVQHSNIGHCLLGRVHMCSSSNMSRHLSVARQGLSGFGHSVTKPCWAVNQMAFFSSYALYSTLQCSNHAQKCAEPCVRARLCSEHAVMSRFETAQIIPVWTYDLHPLTQITTGESSQPIWSTWGHRDSSGHAHRCIKRITWPRYGFGSET